jgi:hypothetical protein
MDAGVAAQIDPGDGFARHRQQAALEREGLAGGGEDRTMVIAIGGDVEEPDPGLVAERTTDGLDARQVAPFAHVGHDLEQRHLGSIGGPKKRLVWLLSANYC